MHTCTHINAEREAIIEQTHTHTYTYTHIVVI